MSAPGVATGELLPPLKSCNVTQWYYFDWIDGSTHTDATTSDGKKWGNLLETLNRQDGCKAAVWATVVEDPSKGWLMIDWLNETHYDLFQGSGPHLSLIQNLTAITKEKPVVRAVGFIDGFWWVPPSAKYYAELVYFFFHANVSADLKHKIQQCHGLVPWAVGDGTTAESGHVLETRGWMQEKVSWRGQEAVVYVFKILWRGASREKIFKEEWRELEDCPDGPLAIERLWERMGLLGILGREQYHGHFSSDI